MELDRRKLYLKYAYPSLFAYLTRRAGYSDGAAQRRIDAARLLVNVPEVAEAIYEGRINLSQVSKVQQVCRQTKKETGIRVEVSRQKDLLKKLENKNSRETDLILAQEFNLEVKTSARIKIQQDESVRVELTFSKEEMTLIEAARALLSNQTGGASAPMKTLKSVTPKLKKEILNRDEFCQFKDPQTGQICGSRFFLKVDHIQPRFLNGPHIQENLRALCRNHNQYRYLARL